METQDHEHVVVMCAPKRLGLARSLLGCLQVERHDLQLLAPETCPACWSAMAEVWLQVLKAPAALATAQQVGCVLDWDTCCCLWHWLGMAADAQASAGPCPYQGHPHFVQHLRCRCIMLHQRAFGVHGQACVSSILLPSK